MNDTEQPEAPLSGTPIAIHTEHGSLHGLRVKVKSGVWPIFSMMRQAASFC
jgi:hypothetical protein